MPAQKLKKDDVGQFLHAPQRTPSPAVLLVAVSLDYSLPVECDFAINRGWIEDRMILQTTEDDQHDVQKGYPKQHPRQ